MCLNLKVVFINTLPKTPHDAQFGYGPHVTTGTAKTPIDAKRLPQPVSRTLMHTQTIQNHSPIPCYNPEFVGSQALGPDVCTRKGRSDIPCQGGQYVPTVVSRHYVACEHLTVRKSSYTQASIAHICSGLVPQSQGITSPSQSSETHLKGSDHMLCIVTPKPPAPHAPCMRALAPSYDKNSSIEFMHSLIVSTP